MAPIKTQGIESVMTTTSTPTSTTADNGQHPPAGPATKGHIGRIVAGSLATSVVAAGLLVAAPFIPVGESAATGAVLCGFAVGWAMLALLSVRRTDQPQRWAVVPALFLGASGLILIAFGRPARDVLSWVWPAALLTLGFWMIVRARRDLRSRSRRWLLYPVIATMAVAAVGGGYETVGEATDAAAYPMPGQLFDVGGHRLHLECTGSGSPTVVLQPGMGEMSSNHAWIARALAEDTRVCAYDRAGRGWSDPVDSPQDANEIATDLHALLEAADVPGPYVMAGHSFGGLYTLTYAARYPDEVAGMVLIDTTAPASATGETTVRADGGSYDALGRVSALLSITARLGLGRLYARTEFGTLPPRAGDEVRANLATADNLRTTIEEFAQGTASAQLAASFRDFAESPLVVLTAGVGGDAELLAAHVDLANLSTNSVHRIIDGATHQSLIADRDDAATTTQAILDVVSSIRRGGPLVS